jgi:hypothetical protein
MTTTFSLTIALKDDTGRTYDAFPVETALVAQATATGVLIFTRAEGAGIDTDTDEIEPVFVLQGIGDDDAVFYFKSFAKRYAHNVLRQRAIGFISTQEETYIYTTD